MSTKRTSASCINLRDFCGDRFKITEESGDRTDPWLQIVLCVHGHICPWSKTTLAASTSRAGAIANRLAALDGARIVQDGADGTTVEFGLEHFDQVAEIIRPRKRRRQSPEAADRLRAFRFPAAHQCDSEAESRDPRAGDDFRAVRNPSVGS